MLIGNRPGVRFYQSKKIKNKNATGLGFVVFFIFLSLIIMLVCMDLIKKQCQVVIGVCRLVEVELSKISLGQPYCCDSYGFTLL